MGIDYFIKISDWKILWYLGRGNFDSESIEEFKENYEELVEAAEDFDYSILHTPFKNFTMKQLGNIMDLVSKMMVLGWKFESLMMIYLLKKENIKFEIINDANIDITKLEEKGWKVWR